MTVDQLKELVEGKLKRHYGVEAVKASKKMVYDACAQVVRDMMMEKWFTTQKEMEEKQAKQICYLSIEFLLGRSLRNNVYNLGLTSQFEQLLSDLDVSFDEICDVEQDAALGNGGLGRLAACYMDGMTAQGLPATGYTILYEHGLFKQRIIEGQQTELPDSWLDTGRSWLVTKQDEAVEVHFGGEVVEDWADGKNTVSLKNYDTVIAVPNDMMISGSDSFAVNNLRLWKAQDVSNFNMKLFTQGQYMQAVSNSTEAETLTKVLYPSDDHMEGKLLRLSQQYFLVSASLQNIIANHLATFGSLANFAEKVAIHINDTHPALVIPEMMRIFIDTYSFSWDTAWNIVQQTVSYTNHTVLPEALEKWNEDLFRIRLPRIYQLVCEINRRWCADLWNMYPGDWNRISDMAIIANAISPSAPTRLRLIRASSSRWAALPGGTSSTAPLFLPFALILRFASIT